MGVQGCREMSKQSTGLTMQQYWVEKEGVSGTNEQTGMAVSSSLSSHDFVVSRQKCLRIFSLFLLCW